MSQAEGAEREKITVGILFGGRSGEHEVSLTSAQGIMRAIDKDKYRVVPIGITKEGLWITGGDPLVTLTTGKGWERITPLVTPLDTCRPEEEHAVEAGLFRLQDLDVIFPVLHGPYGEDGTVQGLLELLSIPFVGAGVTASAVGMDKVICKAVLSEAGLPVLPYRAYRYLDWEAGCDTVRFDCESNLQYPMFVKPANMGSSVGISKVKNVDQLMAGIREAFRFDRKILVEQGIDGREIEISVLGNDEPIVSLPGEIIPSREFYSYAAKYLDDTSELLIPAPISAEQVQLIQKLALESYRAIDCAGMARVDFLIDRASGDVWLNELNTIPGFTPISMYPKLWEASGIGYSDLIDRLIELGLQRHRERSRLLTSFDTSLAT